MTHCGLRSQSRFDVNGKIHSHTGSVEGLLRDRMPR